MDSASVTIWSMGVGVILLLPFKLPEQPLAHTAEQMTSAALALVFLAVVCSVTAFLMWNRAIKMTNPQNIASTMHFKTPVAVVLGVLVANESITSAIIIGMILISAAVWLSQYKRNPASSSITFVTKMQTPISRMMPLKSSAPT